MKIKFPFVLKVFFFYIITFIPIVSLANVIEIATLKLKDGVTYEEFAPIDKMIGSNYVAKQPGFISRESAKGENGEWVVVVHWKSKEDANKSMASFMNAPESSNFMELVDTSSMFMKRYIKVNEFHP